MREINIKRTSSLALNKFIESECGGFYKSIKNSIFSQIGLGGLRYRESEHTVLNVYLEKYNKGIGIKFRNLEHHKMLLVPSDEIKSISLNKKPDLISPRKNSLFLKALRRRWKYKFAKLLAFEDELVKEPSLNLCFNFNSGHELVLECKVNNPDKYSNFFLKTEYCDRFTCNVSEYELVF